MLFRFLLSRRAPGRDGDLSFRTRGAEVSRLEGFSDAVFGFAITLLVISAAAPATSGELLAMRHAVLPFIASFAVLFGLWRAQFEFFRRYGLEDDVTIRLTGILLMIVLIAIYPLKFLCTFLLDVLPMALLAGDDSMKRVMTVGELPGVMLLYALGFTGVTYVFSRLYRNAARSHDTVGLSELELFDTRMLQRRWLGMAAGGATLSAWCVLVMVLGQAGRRDIAWHVGYYLAVPLLVSNMFLQRRALRRLDRERTALEATPPAPNPLPVS